jgi:hypothetical protein
MGRKSRNLKQPPPNSAKVSLHPHSVCQAPGTNRVRLSSHSHSEVFVDCRDVSPGEAHTLENDKAQENQADFLTSFIRHEDCVFPRPRPRAHPSFASSIV